MNSSVCPPTGVDPITHRSMSSSCITEPQKRKKGLHGQNDRIKAKEMFVKIQTEIERSGMTEQISYFS